MAPTVHTLFFTKFVFMIFIGTIYEIIRQRKIHNIPLENISPHCTEMHFASLLSSEFTTMAVINPPENKLANRTSVHCVYSINIHYNIVTADLTPLADSSSIRPCRFCRICRICRI